MTDEKPKAVCMQPEWQMLAILERICKHLEAISVSTAQIAESMERPTAREPVLYQQPYSPQDGSVMGQSSDVQGRNA